MGFIPSYSSVDRTPGFDSYKLERPDDDDFDDEDDGPNPDLARDEEWDREQERLHELANKGAL